MSAAIVAADCKRPSSVVGSNRQQQRRRQLKGIKMKRLGVLLAGAVLIVTGGASFLAKADDDRHGAELFTPSIRATGFHCNADNVSRKTLWIAISIVDLNGLALSAAPAAPATPGTGVSHDVDTSPTPTDAYCQFQVSGTGDPRDIRADLNSTLFHKNTDGTYTFLSRALEAY